eukprot:GEZU01033807.1.p1 GENE.GEZU01033807.1~~GEZU01033807.1.p1  ORF type:complete len:133 (+),score=18.48 GEZU01033807.1:79-477(+)
MNRISICRSALKQALSSVRTVSSQQMKKCSTSMLCKNPSALFSSVPKKSTATATATTTKTMQQPQTQKQQRTTVLPSMRQSFAHVVSSFNINATSLSTGPMMMPAAAITANDALTKSIAGFLLSILLFIDDR